MKIEKNKIGFVLIILSMQVYSCNGQISNVVEISNSRSQKDNSIEILQKYYNKAHETKDSIKYGKLFFDSFPNDFKTFDLIYGYCDKEGARPLFNLYEKHISFFCSLNSEQTESSFFKKLIKLGINGVWDADAVNLLQDCIMNHISEKPDLTLEQLKSYNNEEIRSFWKFLFDGPHPEDLEVQKRYYKFYGSILKLDPTIANLLREEYTKLIRESNKHGKL